MGLKNHDLPQIHDDYIVLVLNLRKSKEVKIGVFLKKKQANLIANPASKM